jgi:uncharacterized membrane protein YbaN (DUF454 family)
MLKRGVKLKNKRHFRRTLWAIAGGIALLLGLIGIPLPLLPTTPFLLLAAFCFSQSSEKLHNWLMTHPKLSPPIKNWQRHGAISYKAKFMAAISMGAALLISYLLDVPLYIILLQIVVLICVCAFLFSRPSPPKN